MVSGSTAPLPTRGLLERCSPTAVAFAPALADSPEHPSRRFSWLKQPLHSSTSRTPASRQAMPGSLARHRGTTTVTCRSDPCAVFDIRPLQLPTVVLPISRATEGQHPRSAPVASVGQAPFRSRPSFVRDVPPDSRAGGTGSAYFLI